MQTMMLLQQARFRAQAAQKPRKSRELLLRISGGFFSKSFSAFAMFLLQSFEQLLQTGVQCGVPARDLNRWLLFLSTATILFARKARQGNPTSITITITFPHGYPQFSHDLHRPNSTHLLFYLYTHASVFRALHLPLLA
jgi:hypothetical protein